MYNLINQCFCLIFILFQLTDFQLKSKISVKGEKLFSDNIGNLYIQTSTTIIKYSLFGEKKAEYFFLNQNVVESFDVFNPMRPILYRNDTEAIEILDNSFVAANITLPIESFGIQNVTAICQSNRESFWVFDSFEGTVFLLGQSKNIITKIKIPAFSENYIISLQERNNSLFVQLDNNKVYIFETYGNLLKTIDIESNTKIQIIGSELYYLSGSYLKRKNIYTEEEIKYQLPIENITDFQIVNNDFIFLTPILFSIYRIE